MILENTIALAESLIQRELWDKYPNSKVSITYHEETNEFALDIRNITVHGYRNGHFYIANSLVDAISMYTDLRDNGELNKYFSTHREDFPFGGRNKSSMGKGTI